jgi:hypothetical protein
LPLPLPAPPVEALAVVDGPVAVGEAPSVVSVVSSGPHADNSSAALVVTAAVTAMAAAVLRRRPRGAADMVIPPGTGDGTDERAARPADRPAADRLDTSVPAALRRSVRRLSRPGNEASPRRGVRDPGARTGRAVRVTPVARRRRTRAVDGRACEPYAACRPYGPGTAPERVNPVDAG